MWLAVMCSGNKALNMGHNLVLTSKVREVATRFKKITGSEFAIGRCPQPIQCWVGTGDEVPDTVGNSEEIKWMDLVEESVASEIHFVPHLTIQTKGLDHVLP